MYLQNVKCETEHRHSSNVLTLCSHSLFYTETDMLSAIIAEFTVISFVKVYEILTILTYSEQ